MKIHELGHIVFYVSNLKKSADFYRDVLGFTEIHRDEHTAMFSSGRTHHEMLLIEVGGSPRSEAYLCLVIVAGLRTNVTGSYVADDYVHFIKQVIRFNPFERRIPQR